MYARNIIIIAVVAILAGGAIWYNQHRSMSDQMMASHMGDAKPIVTDINLPELTTIEKLGKRRFDENCAVCHGENASGREGLAPPLVHIIYEPNHHGDASFRLAVQNGVRAHHWPFGNMPPVPGVSDADVENIISYVRKLQRVNGIF
jgi:cytochrome c